MHQRAVLGNDRLLELPVTTRTRLVTTSLGLDVLPRPLALGLEEPKTPDVHPSPTAA